jgi:hypothetical protein
MSWVAYKVSGLPHNGSSQSEVWTIVDAPRNPHTHTHTQIAGFPIYIYSLFNTINYSTFWTLILKIKAKYSSETSVQPQDYVVQRPKRTEYKLPDIKALILPTNSVGNSPPIEADSLSADQELLACHETQRIIIILKITRQKTVCRIT